MAITLIAEAVHKPGARRHKACAVLRLSDRTLRRWQRCKTLGRSTQGSCPARQRHALKLHRKGGRSSRCVIGRNNQDACLPANCSPTGLIRASTLASESSFYRVLYTQCTGAILVGGCCHRAHFEKPSALGGYGTEPGLVHRTSRSYWRCARRVLPALSGNGFFSA